jgi:hypothetical protein
MVGEMERLVVGVEENTGDCKVSTDWQWAMEVTPLFRSSLGRKINTLAESYYCT